jgi:hypothetical protein
MNSRRLAFLIAFLLLASAAAVHVAIARPASEEAGRLSLELAQLESEISRLHMELRRFQGQEPPSLPPLSELQDRVALIARTLPPEAGYSLKADTPQPFPPGGQPVALQVRVLVTVEGGYDGSVSLFRELAQVPNAAIDELSLSRIQGRPGRLRAFAGIALVFEQTSTPVLRQAPAPPLQTQPQGGAP